MTEKNKKSSKKRPPRHSTDPKKEKKRAKNKKDKKKHKDKASKSIKDKGKKGTKAPKEQIPINSTIETSSHSYLVVKKLGSGGYGDVYESLRITDKKICAVKVEYTKKDEIRRLKREYEIYREITKAKMRNESNAQHLLEVIDYGEVAGLVNFMFIPLCGESLYSIMKKKRPAIDTAINLAIQTLRAVQNFHSFERIHRDIKPANFVLGRQPFHNQVFLIDFGMAVRYCVNEDKMPKSSAYDFIGTLRYASRITHTGNVQTRKDDLESWLYVVMELFDADILPWGDLKNEPIVQSMKEAFFADQPKALFSCIPACFSLITSIINAIQPFDEPKYVFIHEILGKLAEENGVTVDMPLNFYNIDLVSTAKSTPPKLTPGSLTPVPSLNTALRNKSKRDRVGWVSSAEVMSDSTQANPCEVTAMEGDESDSSSSSQEKTAVSHFVAKSAYVALPPSTLKE